MNNLKARNTVGKLNKLDLAKEQISRAKDGKKALKWIEDAAAVATHVSDVTAYLREAIEVFGSDNPISVDAAALRTELLSLFRSEASPDAGQAGDLRVTGEELRRRFAAEAVAAHGRDRLDGAGDERKRRLLEGDIYGSLRRLAVIELLPGGRYAALQQATDRPADLQELRSGVAGAQCHLPRVQTPAPPNGTAPRRRPGSSRSRSRSTGCIRSGRRPSSTLLPCPR